MHVLLPYNYVVDMLICVLMLCRSLEELMDECIQVTDAYTASQPSPPVEGLHNTTGPNADTYTTDTNTAQVMPNDTTHQVYLSAGEEGVDNEWTGLIRQRIKGLAKELVVMPSVYNIISSLIHDDDDE